MKKHLIRRKTASILEKLNIDTNDVRFIGKNEDATVDNEFKVIDFFNDLNDEDKQHAVSIMNNEYHNRFKDSTTINLREAYLILKTLGDNKNLPIWKNVIGKLEPFYYYSCSTDLFNDESFNWFTKDDLIEYIDPKTGDYYEEYKLQ